MLDWRACLYPEIRRVSERDRDRVWRLASHENFRPGEIILIGAALGAAAVGVKYLAIRSHVANAFLTFCADFIVAAVIMVVVAGPAYYRRTKRGLARALEQRLSNRSTEKDNRY